MSIFSCACWPSVCLLRRNVYLDLCPFFDWVVCFLILSCMSFLHILEINSFSVASFANIFSLSVGCLFNDVASLLGRKSQDLRRGGERETEEKEKRKKLQERKQRKGQREKERVELGQTGRQWRKGVTITFSYMSRSQKCPFFPSIDELIRCNSS